MNPLEHIREEKNDTTKLINYYISQNGLEHIFREKKSGGVSQQDHFLAQKKWV